MGIVVRRPPGRTPRNDGWKGRRLGFGSGESAQCEGAGGGGTLRVQRSDVAVQHDGKVGDARPVCLPVGGGPDNFENRQYRDASPLTHVTPDDSPMLLMHGDEDLIVPIRQSEIMESALKQAGVAVRFIKVPGGKHGPNFQLPAGDPRLPDHMGEAVRWFDSQLKSAAASRH